MVIYRPVKSTGSRIEVNIMYSIKSEKPLSILIIGTGGTIAGVSNNNIGNDYRSGESDIGDVIDRVKASPSFCISPGEVNITELNLFNKNSDDISLSDLMKLTELINTHSERDEYDGFVVTHGTDTMEESSLFLSLSVVSPKPVILTGSMIPGDLPGSDSVPNLAGAISAMTHMIEEKKVAHSNDSSHNNIYVYFNGRLMNGICIRKISTNALDSFMEYETEAISLHNLFDNICNFIGLHNICSMNDIANNIKGLRSFPSVPIIPFYMDADPGILDYYVNRGVNGLVIAGAGAGEFSVEFIDRIRQITESGIPVIRTSKIKNGPVNENGTLNSISINGGCVTPEKAAILLRILLAINNA